MFQHLFFLFHFPVYSPFFYNLDNYDFLINPFEDRMSQDNLKLALDSIKNILENPRYQSKFPNRDKIDFLIEETSIWKNNFNIFSLSKITFLFDLYKIKKIRSPNTTFQLNLK